MATTFNHDRADITIQWRFIIQTRSGPSYLHLLELFPGDTGSAVMEKLRKEYHRTRAKAPYTTWDKLSFLWKPVLEVATVSENSSTDLESQGKPRRVLVSTRVRDSDLTTSFHDPEVLSTTEDFVKRNARFAVHPPPSMVQEGRQAIVIRQEFNRRRLWVLAIVVMVFCIGLGVLVGFLTKSIDVGVAVTSGMATVAACIQAFGF